MEVAIGFVVGYACCLISDVIWILQHRGKTCSCGQPWSGQ